MSRYMGARMRSRYSCSEETSSGTTAAMTEGTRAALWEYCSMRASRKPVALPSSSGVDAARAGMMGSSTRMAACSRANSSSPRKGRLMCMLCRLDQPCPLQSKTASKALYISPYSWGQSTVSDWGFMNGCAPVGMSRPPMGASSASAMATPSANWSARPTRLLAGFETFISSTWLTSSLDQVSAPMSTSATPSLRAAAASSLSATGSTQSVPRSTIMYSISMP